MKTKFTLLTALVVTFFAASAQQIPNGGFEQWSNAVTPTSWTSLEDVAGLTSSIFTFKDTVDYVQGAASLKLMSDSLSIEAQAGVIRGTISLGSGSLNGGNLSFQGIPFAYRPDSLFFEYQLTSPGNDTAVAQIIMTKGGETVVLAAHFLLTISSNWSPVVVPLAQFYDTANLLPDTLLIQFQSSNMNPVKGTTLHIDALRFGYKVPAPTISASVTPAGPVTLCTGDSVLLSANVGTNYVYQWNNGGVAISGATGSSYEAHNSGSYTVIIDSGGIFATSNAVTLTDSNCTLGINNIPVAEFKVYPNPASQLLNVNTNVIVSGYELGVYDIVGRLVISQTLEGSNNVVNVAALANGTYLYRITDKQTQTMAKGKFNVLK